MSLDNIINIINWKRVEFKINLPLVVLYLNYLIYGFYGSNTGGELISQLFVTLLIILFHLYLGHISSLKHRYLYVKVSIKLKEILIFLGVLFFTFLISSSYLLNSLEGDEFSFLQSSVIHSLEASHIIIKEYPILSNLPFKYLIHILSASFLIFNIFLIIFTLRLSPLKRTVCLLIFLILFRSIILFFGGGNNSPHPPLSLLPSFLIFSTFGGYSFFIKLGYQFVFGVYLLFLFKKIQSRFNAIIGILIILYVASIPVLIRLSTTLTPSLFTFIVFSYLLVYLSLQKEKNYYLIFFIISVGTMFRIPTLIILIPTIILYLKDNNFSFKFDNKLFFTLSPFLLTIPFLSRTIIEGSPATNYSSPSFSLADNIAYAFETNGVYIAALNSIEIWSLALFPFAFILSIKSINRFTNFIFFWVCILVYYSIKIDLWGLAKYQVEFILPFTIIGLIYLCIKLNFKFMKSITYISLISLIVLNILSGLNYPTNTKNWNQYLNLNNKSIGKINRESAGVIRHVYNIDPAYEYVKNKNLGGALLSLNNDYGIMPEIINGFNSNEIAKIQKNNTSYELFLQENSNEDSEKIINFLKKNPNIQVLILSNWNNERADIYMELINNNWSIAKEFKNPKHNSVTYVLAK